MVEVVLPSVIAVVLGGGYLAALRYQRDDASAVVTQMGQVNEGMRQLLDEYQEAHQRCCTERQKLADELRLKDNEITLLEAKIRKLHRELGR